MEGGGGREGVGVRGWIGEFVWKIDCRARIVSYQLGNVDEVVLVGVNLLQEFGRVLLQKLLQNVRGWK